MIIICQEKIMPNNLFKGGGCTFAFAPPPLLEERGVHLTTCTPAWERHIKIFFLSDACSYVPALHQHCNIVPNLHAFNFPSIFFIP